MKDEFIARGCMVPKADSRIVMNERMYRVLSAYHEAGHAVVGHLIGRYIEEISIVFGKGRYRGYCRFNMWVEDMNLHPEWHETRKNPELITIYYAGMLAMAYICAANEGIFEYLEGSEQSDLEKIDQLLLQIGSDEQQRSHLKETCWKQAQKLLSDHWDAVNTIATCLLGQSSLTGGEAHRLIRKSIGETKSDWRVEVWKTQEMNDAEKTTNKKSRKPQTKGPSPIQ